MNGYDVARLLVDAVVAHLVAGMTGAENTRELATEQERKLGRAIEVLVRRVAREESARLPTRERESR